MNLRRLRTELNQPRPPGVVLNVVAPSCRTNNNEILETICSLRAFVDACVKFWIVVVDNPLDSHVADVKRLQDRLNAEQFSTRAITTSTSFTTRRIRGLAMLATQDTTTPQQILSLSGHNVLPDSHLLDAYIGANWRYPEDKVFVGQTELPDSCTVWTQMLLAGNVGCFFFNCKGDGSPSMGRHCRPDGSRLSFQPDHVCTQRLEAKTSTLCTNTKVSILQLVSGLQWRFLRPKFRILGGTNPKLP